MALGTVTCSFEVTLGIAVLTISRTRSLLVFTNVNEPSWISPVQDHMEVAKGFRSAERSNAGLLAAMEKRTLIWMAERLPSWVNSDHLTALGFLSLAGVGLSYWYARYSRAGLALAIVLFVLNWFGDSLDGTIARVRNQQR